MKILDLFLIVATNVLVIANQVFLKNWLLKYDLNFLPLNWHFFRSLLSWDFIAAIVSLIAGGLIWLDLLKRLDLGLLYPISTGITFVLMLLTAMYMFGEQVSVMRWIGAAVILIGIIIISRS
jgi:multidrug transporter EmrE-like cation transporter